MSRYVVTGTDTGVGKTLVSAALCAYLGASYWKPVQAGLSEETDREAVARLTGLPNSLFQKEAFSLKTPCSPHEAARIDGVELDPAKLALPHIEGPLIVEGAGGVLVPLSQHMLFADMFARWRLPVILVARSTLGTINHSLMSIEALRLREVVVHGVLFSGDESPASEDAICLIGNVRHLGRLPVLKSINQESLKSAFLANVRTELL